MKPNAMRLPRYCKNKHKVIKCRLCKATEFSLSRRQSAHGVENEDEATMGADEAGRSEANEIFYIYDMFGPIDPKRTCCNIAMYNVVRERLCDEADFVSAI